MELADFSNDLTWMFNFCTWIYDCDSHSSAFITVTSHSLSSNPCICSTVVFSSLGNSYHFLDLVLIGFFSNSKEMRLFIAQFTALLVLIGAVVVIIWEMFHGRVYLNSCFCCWYWTLSVGPGWKWCVYPSLISGQAWFISMVFSRLYCCNSSSKPSLSFVFIKSSASTVNIKQASNWCERVLEAAKRVYAN